MDDVAWEIRLRIEVSVGAYAYEIENDPIMPDRIWDSLAKLVQPEVSTSSKTKDNSEIDKWFKKNFSSYSGMWIWNHPDLSGIQRIYNMVKDHQHIKTTDIEEENEEEKRVSLQVITGGRDGTGSGDTWLEKLPLGTLFLIQHKHPSNDWNLGEFCLLGKTNKACILASQEIPRPIKVDPNRFCKAYTCYEELAILDTKDILRDNEDPLDIIITEEDTKVVREPELVVDNTKD